MKDELVLLRKPNWYMIKSKSNDKCQDTCISAIFSFIYDQFDKIFGSDILKKEECTISNSVDIDISELPLQLPFFNNCIPLKITIRANSQSPFFFSNVLFELSHEMCHYVVRQYKNNKIISDGLLEERIMIL